MKHFLKFQTFFKSILLQFNDIIILYIQFTYTLHNKLQIYSYIIYYFIFYILYVCIYIYIILYYLISNRELTGTVFPAPANTMIGEERRGSALFSGPCGEYHEACISAIHGEDLMLQ